MSKDLIDQPQSVRSGEEIDLNRLREHLRQQSPEFHGEISLQQFRKGYSNLTYLLTVGDRSFVLRRPPFGAKIKSAHDMGREFRILSALHELYPKVPKPYLFCEDESVMGAPFYLMERVEGIILRSTVPEGLDLLPEVMQKISASLVSNLASIHGLNYKGTMLAEIGKPEGYVTRQVEGWIKRYSNARTDDIPQMEKVGVWLFSNKPAESGATLIHNDYKYDNVVLDAQNLSQVKAVLDWEMATIGDPLMDLGSTLGYWVDPEDPDFWQREAFGLTTLPGNLDREALLATYEKASGRKINNPVFYYVYGLYKLAVIVQQIYARYKAGQTKDERFSRLIELVKAAARMAGLSLEKKRLSQLDR